MNGLFYNCRKIKLLPDISKWKTSNVRKMKGIFYECSALESLTDISKFNTSKLKDMSWMFFRCISLKKIDFISKWNINKVNNMNGLLAECPSLLDIPKWEGNIHVDINKILYGKTENEEYKKLSLLSSIVNILNELNNILDRNYESNNKLPFYSEDFSITSNNELSLKISFTFTENNSKNLSKVSRINKTIYRSFNEYFANDSFSNDYDYYENFYK